jgi:VIT1/CCC1 family predicted Fe2+/Mn2+ transporter
MDDSELHARVDPHRSGSRLSNVILGGQDGLVNVLGVVLGVAAATRDARIVMAAGLAATLAESLSMAAVAFTSRRADQAHYESEEAREHRHIRRVPALEREEVREIYRRKGLSGPLLDQVVDAITGNPAVWVAVMMAEELHLAPVPTGSALRSALVVGVASLVGSIVPLLPYVLLPVRVATPLSISISALVLFGLGAYKAMITVGSAWRSGLELAAIGIGSALAGYGIGRLFRVVG